jgi:hypothetical protein
MEPLMEALMEALIKALLEYPKRMPPDTAVAMIHRTFFVIPAQAGIHLENHATHGFPFPRE